VAAPVRRGDLYPGTVVDGRRAYGNFVSRLTTRVSRIAVRRRDREEADLDRRLRGAGALTRGNVITIASPKGGVGKTACTFLLGATLAARRGLRVVALDADHDVGTLDLLAPQNANRRTARQALRDLDAIDSAAELSPYMAVHPSGLHILAGPAGSALDPNELAANFGTLVALLERFYDVVLLDLGTGFANPVARFALRRADQAIMVSGSDFVSSARVTKASARLLDPSGPARLRPDRFTVVVNRMPAQRDAGARLGALQSAYRAAGAHTVLVLPEDAQLAAMLDTGTYSLAPLARATRVAIRTLALSTAQRLV
jgi:MinD-like ATPase involved in chromosome partitioning or flagellar assembly